MTEDGFTPMEMRTNFSLKCEVCGEYPKKFYWKPVPGGLTRVCCHGCPRG